MVSFLMKNIFEKKAIPNSHRLTKCKLTVGTHRIDYSRIHSATDNNVTFLWVSEKSMSEIILCVSVCNSFCKNLHF